ncbi:MAG TPA: hypothetical protein ENN46_01165 [Candidatus Woesearchaeota archaeon]|nr:hypothetical protein [Candidatus Woesearchaeota archaeon]
MGKRVYNNLSLKSLKSEKDLFRKDAYYKTFLAFLKYREEISDYDAAVMAENQRFRKLISNPGSNADNYTPTDTELLATLRLIKASAFNRFFDFYLALACSGARVAEIADLCNNAHSYKKVQMAGFSKYLKTNVRGTKKSFVIYLPDFVNIQKVSLTYLQHKVLKNNPELLRPKYLRKYFCYTASGLNIPADLIDYYQGRVPDSIQSKHYLSKQERADFFYKDKLVPNFLRLYDEI